MNHKPSWMGLLYTIVSLALVIAVLGGAHTAVAQEAKEVDLAIELKAPQHVAPGASFVINLSYSNLGSAASPEDTWVQISLPEGSAFVSAADPLGNDMPPDEIVGNILTWQVGSILAGSCCQHILITVLAEEDLAQETLLTSEAEIGSSAVESLLENNTSSVTSTVCDMAGSTKQAHSYLVKPGDVVTYTITLRMAARHGLFAENQRNIQLTDTLPPQNQAKFLGWVGENSGTFDGEHLHWQGQVRAGEPLTFQYRLGIVGDLPPGTPIVNRAHLGWDEEEMDIEPVTVATYMTEDDHIIGPEGGQWQHQYGVTVEVPPNALQAQTRFQFQPLFEDAQPPDAPFGYMYAHRAFSLTAFQNGEIHQFNQPITITIRYNGGDTAGLNQNTLRLWYRQGPGEPWAMLGEPQNQQIGQVSFVTDHFTEFGLFGVPGYRLSLPIVLR